MRLPPPRSTLFPYTTLFRSEAARRRADAVRVVAGSGWRLSGDSTGGVRSRGAAHRERRDGDRGDRKSTRLNSSHLGISYAVFCLKKKKKKQYKIPVTKQQRR